VSRGAVTVEGEPAPMPEPAVIEVVDATKSDPQLSNLSALTIAESEPVIAAETDIDLLSQWRDADDRKGIKELIRDRLRDLSPTL
jgi:translation initiation factor 2 gamma subunit (eIF-2gamma)